MTDNYKQEFTFNNHPCCSKTDHYSTLDGAWQMAKSSNLQHCNCAILNTTNFVRNLTFKLY